MDARMDQMNGLVELFSVFVWKLAKTFTFFFSVSASSAYFVFRKERRKDEMRWGGYVFMFWSCDLFLLAQIAQYTYA